MATRAMVYEKELLEALRRELKRAARFNITVALVTHTAVPLLLSSMRDCLRRGAHGEMLVGVDLPSHPDALEALLELHAEFSDTFSLKYFKSPAAKWFHPKVYMFEPRHGRRSALVGSSNMTAGGLQNNYEASFWSDDAAAVDRLAFYCEELHNGGHARRITVEWLEMYRRLWDERRQLQQEEAEAREKVRRIRSDSTQRRVPTRIKGYTFVFTGAIADWPRNRKLYPRVRSRGGKIGYKAASLRSANFLVHGSGLEGKRATLKLKAAKKLGVPIISDEEFLEVLNERS